MDRYIITLAKESDKQRAIKWIAQAKPATRLEFKPPKRSLPQNDKLWSMLTEIARTLDWHGQKLSTLDWKLLFMDALKQELRIAPNLAGTGFVNLGRSSSKLSTQEFSDLLELVTMFGANHGVVFRE